MVTYADLSDAEVRQAVQLARMQYEARAGLNRWEWITALREARREYRRRLDRARRK